MAAARHYADVSAVFVAIGELAVFVHQIRHPLTIFELFLYLRHFALKVVAGFDSTHKAKIFGQPHGVG